MVSLLSAFAALVLTAGCDWLLNFDTVPPTCQLVSPADSAKVDSMVALVAIATDSFGVERVEFYADGSLVAADSAPPFTGSWDASGLTEHTWHLLSCLAYDLAGNDGYSDTVAVEIVAIGQTSVFHGEMDVPARGRAEVSFEAETGDSLVGDLLVVTEGTLTKFLWLDQDNYQKYLADQTYTTLYQVDYVSQMSMRQAVTAVNTYHLVFANGSNAIVKCWARFVLE